MRLDALALERVARGAAAEQDRREEQAHLVDLARVEERARELRAALQQDRRDARPSRAGRAPSARARARSRRSRRRRRRPTARAPRSPSGAPRATRRRSAAAPAPHATSCESSGRRAVASKTTWRGWWWTPSTRAVSADRRPARCRSRPRRRRRSPASGARARAQDSSEIHCESPVRVATLPSSVIADLNSTHGRPVRACLRKAWLTSRARRAMSPSATSTSTPSSRRIPSPRPDAFALGSSDADDDARDAGREDRVRARRRLAVMAARLHRDVQRRARQLAPAAAAFGDRVDLGVRPAVLLVPALAEDGARRARAARRPSGWDARARARTRRARSRGPGARGLPRSAGTRARAYDSRAASRGNASAATAAQTPALQAVDRHLRARAGCRPAGSSRTSSRS